MRVLVTGARGFVGQVLCKRIESGPMVLRAVVRNAATGDNEIALGSLDANTEWSEALNGVDTVIHLAGRAHAADSPDADLDEVYRRANVEVTRGLVDAAIASGVRRFIFVSSIKVNGESTPPGQAFRSEDPPAPEDAYGRSKLECENYVRDACATASMDWVVIRPPLVYGPGAKANFFALMKLIDAGIPLPLGSIDNRRSFVGLDNLVDLIMLCIQHPKASNRIFLVSDDDDLSTTQLTRLLAHAMERPARLIPVPRRLLAACLRALGKGRIAQRLCQNLQVDASETMDTLGWRPAVSVATGLRKTANAFYAKAANGS